jgi:hypothetical protein
MAVSEPGENLRRVIVDVFEGLQFLPPAEVVRGRVGIVVHLNLHVGVIAGLAWQEIHPVVVHQVDDLIEGKEQVVDGGGQRQVDGVGDEGRDLPEVDRIARATRGDGVQAPVSRLGPLKRLPRIGRGDAVNVPVVVVVSIWQPDGAVNPRTSWRNRPCR